jgi:multidrug efflux pump
MDITRAAIEKKSVTFVTLFVIILGGLLAYSGMPRSEDPGFEVKTATIVTYYPGANPERVENLVTDKIEKKIQEIGEVDYIKSETKNGVSVIWFNIQESYRGMKPFWDRLRNKVDDVRPQLPKEVIGPYVNDEFGDVFGIIVTITGDDFKYREIKEIADRVRDELLLLKDASKVDIYGAQDERVFVEFNNARLAALGLSAAELQNILESKNIIYPGGDITTKYEKIFLEPSGNFESIEEIKRAVINLPGRNEVIHLEDIVEIKRGYIDPPSEKMRMSGKPALGLAISLREGGNVLDLGEQVKAVIDRSQAFYPVGIEFGYAQFMPEAVSNKINAFVGNLVQAVVVVAIVMFLFLGLRTGLIITSLIPTAMIMTFLFMSFAGFGLDQISLASLIIALGMLVDNGIVMSESIMVQMAGGKEPVAAAIDSANELKIPLLTSTLTTGAAFLPIALAKSNTGEYCSPIFWVVTATLLCSWIISLTVVPLLCTKFLKVELKEENFDTRFYSIYRGFLLSLVKHPLIFLVIVGVAFFGSLKLSAYVPKTFFPPNDRPTASADIELPLGTPIERSEAVVAEIEDYIKKNLMADQNGKEGVTSFASFIGRGGPRYILPYSPELATPNYSYMIINATSRPALEVLVPKVEDFAQKNFPDVKATVRALDLGPATWPPVEIRLMGRDPKALFNIVDKLKARMRSIPGTKLIDDDWGPRQKKITVSVNEARAARANVTNQDVAISLQAFLSGFETSDYREVDRIIPITLRSVEADRKNIDNLETLNVYAQATGESVPLTQVADIDVAWEYPMIARRDRLKTVTVECATEAGVTATDVTNQLGPWLSEEQKKWPLGYKWEFGGEKDTSGKAQKSIGEQLPMAGLIILLLLVGQFNSVRSAAIILLTIPLALIGVYLGLFIFRSPFSFFAILGVISLAGIVINNAIVLIDRIRIEMEENGLEPAQAIIASAQKRLRPILLTTCTTISGLIPLYLGGGPMWEPMAITIMCGLLFATVLTLAFVPVLYSIFYRVSFRNFEYKTG